MRRTALVLVVVLTAEARSDSALAAGVFRGDLYAWSTIYAGAVGTPQPPR
jgi:hypothetical protein